jgi:hypothetical protein
MDIKAKHEWHKIFVKQGLERLSEAEGVVFKGAPVSFELAQWLIGIGFITDWFQVGVVELFRGRNTNGWPSND